MNKAQYDVIVIGAGTAGLGAYRKAKQEGKSVVLIEKSDKITTTCANVGCMPSKLLIAAAEVGEVIHKSAEFGVSSHISHVNPDVLWGRVRAERDRFVGFVERGAQDFNVIHGTARFVAPNQVEVNGNTYSAKAVVLATGSRNRIPSILQPVQDKILTNETFFEQTTLPESILVVGAGVIGVELGQALSKLGTTVIFVHNQGSSVAGATGELAVYFEETLRQNHRFIEFNDIEKIEYQDTFDNFLVHLTNGQDFTVNAILSSAGRDPNLLNLPEVLGFSINELMAQFEASTTQVGTFPVFLAGDVNADRPLLHEAAHEGAIAGSNAAHFPEVSSFKRKTPMAVAFTSPQVMRVGSFSDLDLKGFVSFEDQGRSRVMLKNKGFLNVYFDKQSHVFKGAEMIGPDAEHIAHLLAWSVEMGATLEQMLEFPYYHPVVEEGLRTAVRDAATKV